MASGDRDGAGVLSFRVLPGAAVQGGCLCFEGTRIPVDVVLNLMPYGTDDAVVLASYPSLTKADLDAARLWNAKWKIIRRRNRQEANRGE